MASERTKLDVLVEQQKILQDQIWIAEINRDVIKEMMGEDHKDAKKQDLEDLQTAYNQYVVQVVGLERTLQFVKKSILNYNN